MKVLSDEDLSGIDLKFEQNSLFILEFFVGYASLFILPLSVWMSVLGFSLYCSCFYRTFEFICITASMFTTQMKFILILFFLSVVSTIF